MTPSEITADPRHPHDWYLAQVRPNQTDRARRNLERQGYGCFLPLLSGTSRAGGRLRSTVGALFPGYLFVSIDPHQPWRPVNGTFGVQRLVMRSANMPQPVPAAAMAALFGRVDAGGLLRPEPDLAAGDAVRIEAGPLAGFVARVERLEPGSRVGVLLEMMGQAVRTTLPTAHLHRLAG